MAKRRTERSIYDGPLCPFDKDHGPMYYLLDSQRWYCPHVDHLRGKEPTKALYKTAEIES